MVMIRAGPAADVLRGCLHGCSWGMSAAASAPASHSLGIATLISWLLAEILGAYMLRSWFASGGARERRSRLDAARSRTDTARPRTDTARLDTISMPLVLGHAGLAFAGFTCWVSFLISGADPLAWLSVGFLAPAIGLGISTVTVWTPYPARRPEHLSSPEHLPRPGPDQSGRTGETLDETLADEALTTKLVEDLLARMLAEPTPSRRPRWQLAPLVPALHGLLAITTFLLAMLAAIAAIAGE